MTIHGFGTSWANTQRKWQKCFMALE